MEESKEIGKLKACLIGKQIKQGTSSLKQFAIELTEEPAILLEADGDASCPTVSISAPPKSALPKIEEAVCLVDWSWLGGARIVNLTINDTRVILDLGELGPLTVTAAAWRGAPFLSFLPYKPQ